METLATLIRLPGHVRGKPDRHRPWPRQAGRAPKNVHVSAMAAPDDAGQALCKGDPEGQTRAILHTIEGIPGRAGTNRGNVLHTSRPTEAGRAHAEAFAEAPPAISRVHVLPFAAPEMPIGTEAAASTAGAVGAALLAVLLRGAVPVGTRFLVDEAVQRIAPPALGALRLGLSRLVPAPILKGPTLTLAGERPAPVFPSTGLGVIGDTLPVTLGRVVTSASVTSLVIATEPIRILIQRSLQRRERPSTARSASRSWRFLPRGDTPAAQGPPGSRAQQPMMSRWSRR
ncbi:hypothetical protein [Frigidibacter sp. MR17.24]|uniref:hypothetical protein n=1 Tax=Frigidibacter sp. MR17.24 TaxID=3127345 RepID=UPI00301303AA